MKLKELICSMSKTNDVKIISCCVDHCFFTLFKGKVQKLMDYYNADELLKKIGFGGFDTKCFLNCDVVTISVDDNELFIVCDVSPASEADKEFFNKLNEIYEPTPKSGEY